MKKSVSTLYGEKIMDKDKEAVIDEILYGLEKLGSTVIKGGLAVKGTHEPFLLMWALKKMCIETSGNIARDRAFGNVEEGLSGDKINLKQNDIERVLEVIEKTLDIPENSLKELFMLSSHAFEKFSEVNDTQKIKIPFHKLDITTDSGDVYDYVLMKNLGSITGTDPEIAKTAAAILKVDDGETFTDFMSGTGLTTEIVTKGKKDVKFTLIDNSPRAFALSALYLFLTDKEGKAILEDSISQENIQSGEKADKIFVIPEKGRMMSEIIYNGKSLLDIQHASAIRAANTLKEHGKAVLGLTSNFAFGTRFNGDDVREYLVENNFISAVILLPNLYKDTSIPTLLLVLSKNDNSSILMADLTSKEKDEEWFCHERKYEPFSPTAGAIRKIEEIERERKTEDSISVLISKEKIKENSYNLLPSLYIEKTQHKFRSISEIEKDIDKVLGELKDLLG